MELLMHASSNTLTLSSCIEVCAGNVAKQPVRVKGVGTRVNLNGSFEHELLDLDKQRPRFFPRANAVAVPLCEVSQVMSGLDAYAAWDTYPCSMIHTGFGVKSGWACIYRVLIDISNHS